MDIQEHIVQLAKDGGTFAELVRSATRAVAEDLKLNSSYLFLYQESRKLEKDRELALEFCFGDVSDRTNSELAANLAAHALATVHLAFADSPLGTLLAVPLISRGRPIGALVVGQGGLREAFPDNLVASVLASASQMVDLIAGARAIRVTEGAAGASVDPAPSRLVLKGERSLSGTPASSGIAIGTVAFRQVFPHQIVQRDAAVGSVQSERERLRDAFQKTQNDLVRMQSAAAGEIGEDQALIFAVQLLLLRDPLLLDRVERALVSGSSAAVAVVTAAEDIEWQLSDMRDPYIRERADDVEDLCSRILGYLLDTRPSDTQGAHIVVGLRTTPSIIMELKAHGAVGVASELDGTTSHGVLLARAVGVPAVTGVVGLMKLVESGDLLIIDGDEGKVIVRPTPETLADYTRRAQVIEHVRHEFHRYRELLPRTRDGVDFILRANIALGIDLDVASENGAQGVGLYRTEFPFIARSGIPTRDEQVRIYAKAYQAFPDGPISFRILDLAGDKSLGSLDLGLAHNSFHGYRSIRVLFDYPHILRDQVQAFAIAANGRPLRILVPMVSSLEELHEVKRLVGVALAELPSHLQRPSPIFGAMVEVPAAIEIIGDLAAEVEFFSIGTNDLIQYSLVVDREDPRLASPRNGFHPAILRMIKRAIEVARVNGKEISVCGEMAAQPELALFLIAAGVSALSVTPRAIPELKHKLAGVVMKPLIRDLNSVLANSYTANVEQTLRQYLVSESPVPSVRES